MINEVLFKSWVEKEKRTSASGKRKYPHFDPKINFHRNISFFKSFFSDRKHVSNHAFYPFIRMVLTTPRYKKTGKKSPSGKPIRAMSNKERPLAYSAHFDAFIYSWYSTVLTERYERKISSLGIRDSILAYLEKGLSNIEFAHEVFQYIKDKGECVALAFDISSFFDGLDHDHLKKMWCKVLNKAVLPPDHFNVFKSLTAYTYIDKHDLEVEFPFLKEFRKKKKPIERICNPEKFRQLRTKKLIRSNPFKITLATSSRLGQICGIPQGSPISACLSNIYMLDFDKQMQNFAVSKNLLYRRYCDDIIFITPISELTETHQTVLKAIGNAHLSINDDKTEITYFRHDTTGKLRGYDSNNHFRNLQYLGFEFNGTNVYIRSSSMSRYNRRMSARIRENIKAAYGKNAIGTTIFTKTLYNKYSIKGERNFISYAERASKLMQSPTIYKQYKNSLLKVKNKLSDKKAKFEKKKKPLKIMK